MALASPAGGLNFRSPDGRDLVRFAGEILGRAGLRDDMDLAAEGVGGRKQGIDEGGFERIGESDPGRLGFRGRNCRKS